MYDFRQTELEEVIIHKIGNRAKEEDVFLSQDTLKLDEGQKAVLLSYYLNPFKTDEYFQFVGEEAAEEETRFNGNRMYGYVRNLYKEPDNFVEHSQEVAKFLFELSTHPKIISGELHVVRFSNIIIDEEVVSAVGFFKSETKEPFIKLMEVGNSIDVNRQEGISLKKVDRACLILNTDKGNGYKILNIDKSKGDAKPHWQYDFLTIQPRREDFYNTNNFISLIKNFSDEVLVEENNIQPSDQIAFIQRTEDFLKEKDNFTTEEFVEEVIGDEEITSAFNNYIPNFENDYDIEIKKEFPVSKQAVKSNKKYFKSVIKLDKSFHVYVHTNPDNLEKGFDQARSMKFYKLYYKEEE